MECTLSKCYNEPQSGIPTDSGTTAVILVKN